MWQLRAHHQNYVFEEVTCFNSGKGLEHLTSQLHLKWCLPVLFFLRKAAEAEAARVL